MRKIVNTEIRDYKLSDHNFVIASFLKGVYYGNKFYGMIEKNTFMANYKYIAEALITQNVVKMACLKDDPDTILGYSILSKDFTTVHWVFLKKDWRSKFGIFKQLVPMNPVSYSHFTTQGLDIAKHKFPNTTFNPFKLI